MLRSHHILYIALVVFLVSCNAEYEPDVFPDYTNDQCYRNAFENGHIYRLEDKIWLAGGDEIEQDFDFSNTILRPCQLNLALGRERYPALIEPEYDSVPDHINDLNDSDSVIIIMSETQTKVYPIDILRQHIVVNESADGLPVMITYDIFLKDAQVYRRNYCDTLFTFAVSGYSYWDFDVMDAQSSFLLWDRETESLWWPLIKKAVSGKMNGNWLVVHDQSKWSVTSWKDVV